MTSDNKLGLMALIIAIGVIGIFSSDMYVPSLPHIARAFGTSDSSVQFTITNYFLGLAFSQLFYGPLSDIYGRKKILLIGLLIGLAGVFICLFSKNINFLLMGRVIQGMGMGATLSLTRAIARDIFEGDELAKVGSYFSLLFALTPAIAPIMGSYLEHWYGWRSVFIFLSFYTLIALCLTQFLLPETNLSNQNKIKNKFNFKNILKNYKNLITHPIFLTNTISSTMAISGLITYYTLSPFIFQNTLGLSVIHYGWLSIFIFISMILGRFLNIILIKYFDYRKILSSGCFILFLSGLVLLLFGFLNILNLWLILLPILLFILGSGFIFSNAMAGALNPFGHMAGSASALYGCIQMLGCFAASGVAAVLPHSSVLVMGAILFGLGAVAVFVNILLAKKTQCG